MKSTFYIICIMVFGLSFTTRANAQKPYRVSPQDTQVNEKNQILKAVAEFENLLLKRDVVSLSGALQEDLNVQPAVLEIEDVFVETKDGKRLKVGERTVKQQEITDAKDTKSEKDKASDTADTIKQSDNAKPDVPPGQAVAGAARQNTLSGPKIVTVKRQIPTGRQTKVKNRNTVTTAANNNTEAQRKTLRSDLTAIYDRLPLHIRIHIVPEDIDVQGNTATVQAAFYLRRLFGDPNDAPTFAKAQPERITLQLIKTGNQWAVKDMANFATRLSSTVPQ